ncbi:MAG TPA: hypothetical protein VKR06_30020 [Ktedonosporobacter sp.]|nr:hypothetical protein [Ktedonosporobacter sp.]
MITCNRCGYTMNPDGVGNCQRCGTPVSSKVEGGFGPRMGSQEQPELPAWLESLRVGDRSAAPVSDPTNPANFSPADLIDEGTLPSWMRAERAGMANNPPSDPYNKALRPASSPAPTTDTGSSPARGLNAQSLIDERALPSWMQEGKNSATSAPPSGIEASSLIQSDAVPEWMKTIQQSNASGARPAPVPPVQPMSPARNAQSMGSGVRPEGSDLAASSAQPLKGFSPKDLIDEKSLPSWMTQQNGGSSPSGAPVTQSGVPGQPGSLSPSSLLDVNALPPWLREQGQQSPPQNGMVSPSQSQQPPQAVPPWQASQSFPPTGPVQSYMNGAGTGLPASSFVDPNALPEWLRASAGQSAPGAQMSPQGPMGNQRPAPYAVPPRVENVRVPNRPRSELAANESSEVAANVFASMLGVASAAPHFPGPPADPSASYGQSYSMPQNMPPAAGMSGPPAGMVYGTPGAMSGPAYGAPGQPPQAYSNSSSAEYGMGSSGVYNSGYPGGGQGNYPGGPPPSGAPPYSNYRAGGAPPPGAPEMAGEDKRNKKRKGVAGLIDWLFSR